MRTLKHLFDNNRRWADQVRERDPDFFTHLADQQAPDYLWIGCSDSRVPANEIVGLLPGELFAHRNVANVVVHTDLNCQSVIQYAVEALQVEHIIVCGHYGCGGVQAAMQGVRMGLIDKWLRHVHDVMDVHNDLLEDLDEQTRHDRLCELNVVEQVRNVCRTSFVQDAWDKDQPLSVHGWIYSLSNGRLHDLDLCVTSAEEVKPAYRAAIEARRPE